MAIKNLRSARVLSLDGIRTIPLRRLQHLIRSSGYFRQKARKLKRFVKFLDRQYGGSLSRMFAQPTALLRDQLLSLNGVGPETADSILLYAGQHPVFVVDAYTRRLASRHGILDDASSYEEFRRVFEKALSEAPVNSPLTPASGETNQLGADALIRSGANQPSIEGSASHKPSRMSLAARSPLVQVFNEMHGLIVSAGKQYCWKAKAQCQQCPLGPLLPPDPILPRN